jgi:TatD DNase family protein
MFTACTTMTAFAKNTYVINKILFHAGGKDSFYDAYFAANTDSLFINLHTHQSSAAASIRSLYEHFERSKEPGFYSIGLHPCYLSLSTLDDVKQWAVYEQVLAIGECGLDKICDTNFELQQQVFYKQVLLANELNKPLIIHCVRAFEEALSILKHAKVPVIFHGFNKSKELALQLTSKGYYLSFGKALEQERVKETLASIPPEQVFLETDMAEVSIESIYELAADALAIELNSLSLQLQKNARAVFGEMILQP